MEGEIAHVQVHADSGALITATKRILALWTINGTLLALTPKSLEGRVLPDITAIAYSHGPEWDEDNVIVTGHTDGVLRFWSLQMDTPQTEKHETGFVRLMQLRTCLPVCTAMISTILVEPTGQSLWVGDMAGKVYHASVASAAPVTFNALAAHSAIES